MHAGSVFSIAVQGDEYMPQSGDNPAETTGRQHQPKRRIEKIHLRPFQLVYKIPLLSLFLSLHPPLIWHRLQSDTSAVLKTQKTPHLITDMHFSIFAIVAALASFAAASPTADPSPAGVAHRRAINLAYFTESELADKSES